MWFDGAMDWATVGEEFDSSELIGLAVPTAAPGSEGAMIFPFKEMLGRQPFDAGNNVFVVPFLFPNGDNAADAFWKSWDWSLAATRGMEAAGLEFSGELAFVDTVMYWPITHQVAPASEALDCTACHSEESVLDFAALGYSEEEIVLLSSVPSVEEPADEVVEEAAEDVVEDAATETTEDTAADTTDTAAETEAAEESSSNSALVIAIVVVVLLVVVSFGFSRRKKA
jgi:hypothetical protein